MSTETWVAEYRLTSTEARAVARRGSYAIFKSALHKVEGLQKANLDRHDIRITRTLHATYITDYDGKMVAIFTGAHCAACQGYRPGWASFDCTACPVVERTGKKCYDPEGFMSDGVMHGDFAHSLATLQEWWRELYPDKPLPEFEQKPLPEEVS
jgi:hypothetical protein